MVLKRLLLSIGSSARPRSSVKISPVSCHALPALSRCSRWGERCIASAAVAALRAGDGARVARLGIGLAYQLVLCALVLPLALYSLDCPVEAQHLGRLIHVGPEQRQQFGDARTTRQCQADKRFHWIVRDNLNQAGELPFC